MWRFYKLILVLLLVSCSGSYSLCQCVGSQQIGQDSVGEITVIKIFFKDPSYLCRGNSE